MYSTISQSLQSYAIGFAQQCLRETSAPLQIISRVDGNEKIIFEDNSKPSHEIAVVYVNDPNFWARVLSDFDLVCDL